MGIIKENKIVRKQENNKKVIKKKRKFFLFFSWSFSCFLDRFLGWVTFFLPCFLFFLIAFLVEFFFSFFLVFFYKFPPQCCRGRGGCKRYWKLLKKSKFFFENPVYMYVVFLGISAGLRIMLKSTAVGRLTVLLFSKLSTTSWSYEKYRKNVQLIMMLYPILSTKSAEAMTLVN